MDVKSARSLGEYFHEALTRALRNQRLEITEMTECYLVNLLAEFARTSVPEEALAIKMCEGLQALPAERAQKLKEVGDTSLFVSGFFPDSLNSSLIDVDYYIGMGEVAYGQLSRLVARKGRSGPFGEVFVELSGKFARFVQVLAEVSSDSATGSPVDVLRLYEKYIKTGNAVVAQKLRERGFFVKKGMVH